MDKTIIIKDSVEAGKFICQLVREGVTFNVVWNEYDGYTITLTGGF